MKRLIQILAVLCFAVLAAPSAFAANKETLQEGVDLSQIHRLAVAYPLYSPTQEEGKPTKPTVEELIETIYDASHSKGRNWNPVAENYEVLSYATIVENIRRDRRLDIKALNRRKALPYYKKYVGDYADAYVVVTVVDSTRTRFFFEVFGARTGDLLYVYEHGISRFETDDPIAYRGFCEAFYRKLDEAITTQQKNEAKAEEKRAKEAAKEKKDPA